MESRWTRLAVAGLLLSTTAFAQAWKGPARVEGVVLDVSGQPIAGAQVEMRMGTSPTGPSVKTDKKGRWAILGLAGGGWNVDITADGYMPRRLGGVQVTELTRQPPIEVKLEPMPKEVAQSATSTGTGVPPEVVEAVQQGDDALMAGKFADAVAAYEKAAPALPEHVGLMMQMARAYHGAGSEAKSVAMLEKVVAKEPGNVGALLLLGNSELEKGNLEKGRAYLERVPASAITDPNTYVNIGILYLNKNKPLDAEEYFGRALGVDATFADGYYYRGLARYQGKKLAEARADFTKFLELSPTSKEAKEVKELLATFK